jgi:GTPase
VGGVFGVCMFVDRIEIDVAAGDGGNGVIAWRREKSIPKGGPAGGDGGKGGSVLLYVDPNCCGLEWFRHVRRIAAESGGKGGSANKKGADGEDTLLKIPPGTIARDMGTGEVLYDGVESHEQFVLCRGGKGGRGNVHFKSPTNRAPQIATLGEEGEKRIVEFELKLIADVGLVGFPNAGKSTLLSKLACRDVEIGAYPFTTLVPNIGYITYGEEKRIYLSDIPGIIEGAHQNRGLGLEFLRHIERTKVLLFVLDAAGTEG